VDYLDKDRRPALFGENRDVTFANRPGSRGVRFVTNVATLRTRPSPFLACGPLFRSRHDFPACELMKTTIRSDE
jgi:hypothetical protein